MEQHIFGKSKKTYNAEKGTGLSTTHYEVDN